MKELKRGLCCLAIAFGIFLMSNRLSAAVELKKQLIENLDWGAEVEHVTSISERNQIHLYGGSFKLRSRATFNSFFSMRFDLKYSWFDGLSQLETELPAYEEGAGFSYFNFSILNYLDIGIIDQQEFENPLLLHDIGLPGIFSKYTYRWFSFFAEVAVPSSKGIQVDRVSGERLPLLYIGAARLKNRYLNITGGLYSYVRPTSLMASRAIYVGNTTDAIDDRGTFFYNYRGIFASLDFDLKMFRFKWAYVNNREVKSSLGDAFWAQIGFGNKLGFDLSYFYSEPDSTIGLYSHKDLGHNNNKGYSLSLSLREDEYTFTINYYNYQQIRTSNYNRQEQKLTAVLEILYE